MRIFFAIKRLFVNTKLKIDIGIAEAIRDEEIEKINETRKAVLQTCGVDKKFIHMHFNEQVIKIHEDCNLKVMSLRIKMI